MSIMSAVVCCFWGLLKGLSGVCCSLTSCLVLGALAAQEFTGPGVDFRFQALGLYSGLQMMCLCQLFPWIKL